MRTTEQKQEILSRLEPTNVYENVINSSWISRLKTVFNDGKKTYKNTGPVTMDFFPEKEGYTEWFTEFNTLLRPFIGDNVGVFAANFFKVQKPHILHNDDSVVHVPRLHKTVVIPIEISKPSNFAVFDQCYLDGPVKIRSRHKPAKNVYYNQDLYDNSKLINYTGQAFDETLYNKYFTHQDLDTFWGLSVEQIVPWKPGNIITFDTARIHSAVNFNAQGIEEKLGLSIFTYLK